VASGASPGPLPPGRHRDELVAEVRDRLRDLAEGARVLVACSGGPDSTALAFLVAEARPDLEAALVYVAHGLRAAEADRRERELVEQHAAWLGTAATSLDVEVVRTGRGPEGDARHARYAALAGLAARRRARAVLVGHTADDQAETVLLRLARGTGLDGAAAMATVEGRLRRPLLRLRREDVHAFVAGEGLPTLLDATNRDPAVPRVVVRDTVLPALRRVGPDPVAALHRFAALAADDAAAMAEAARGALRPRWYGDAAVWARGALRELRPGLGRRVVRAAFVAWTPHAPAAATVEIVRTASPGTRRTLPGGLRLEVTSEWTVLAPPYEVPAPRALSVPGRTPWLAAGLVVHTRTPADDPGPEGVGELQPSLALSGAWTPATEPADPDAVPPGGDVTRLEVWLPERMPDAQLRAPRAGDRIVTGGGTRRVAAVLREAGMPRMIRERWPLLTVGERVAWVPGLGVDAELAAAGRSRPGVAVSVRGARG
jgi:tRNA(Ile)-lysidine synthase